MTAKVSAKASQTTDCAQIFAALGHPARLAIIETLAHATTYSISDMTEMMVLTRQSVTKHLQVLEEAGLVKAVASGRERIYKLTPSGLSQAKTYLDSVDQQWTQSMDRFKAYMDRSRARSE